MFTIEINSTGIKKKATIEKLFLHNGPFCITQSKNKDGFPVPLARLDYIETVEVVNDLSRQNQCLLETSPLAIATKLVRRDSDANLL